jgi:hypothetical protein
MAQFHFVSVYLMAFLFLGTSTLFNQALVIKSNSNHARNSPVHQNVASESTLPTNAERRSITKKVGGFVGGKMFDYFLSRFVC